MRLPLSQHYDIFGDIHGHGATLAAALSAKGYGGPGGLRAPTGHHAVFVGDLVDRGPNNKLALQLVMELVARDDASMVIGNHDLNFIALRRPHPTRPRQMMRVHSKKNLAQSATTIAEAEAEPAFFAEAEAFLLSRPVFLENEHLRVVHACPDLNALARLRASGHVRADGTLNPDADQLAEATALSGSAGDDRSLLLSGPEYDLPGGASYQDADGVTRTSDRLSWWLSAIWHDRRLTVFGHYAMKGLKNGDPWHFSPSNSACVDAGLGKGGPLAVLSITPVAAATPVFTLFPPIG